MKPKRIILVDDSKAYRFALRKRLSKIGNNEIVAEASNGQEFLDILQRYDDIDVVFLDIEMPVMNGIVACEKALKIRPDIDIYALTLYDNSDYVIRMINAGAKGYLVKFSANKEELHSIMYDEKEEGKPLYSKEVEAPTQISGKTILVVDDFQISNEVVSQVLQQEGYRVLEAKSATSALSYFDGTPIDMIITDYKMPGMDGIQFITEIRKIDQYKQTPAIILSAINTKEIRKKGFAAGATGWMQKPFDTNKMLQIIKKALK